MRFQGVLQLHGKTATGFEVPAEVLDRLGGGRRPPVRVTLNGHTYRTSIGSMGGRSLLPVSAEVRRRAGIAAGDEVDVEVVIDTEERTVEVPEDLDAALAGNPVAAAAFGRLSHSVRSRFALAIEQARSPDTRRRRVERAVVELSGEDGPARG